MATGILGAAKVQYGGTPSAESPSAPVGCRISVGSRGVGTVDNVALKAIDPQGSCRFKSCPRQLWFLATYRIIVTVVLGMSRKLLPIDVSRPELVADMFYRSYKPDHWMYRVQLLKTVHDESEQVGPMVSKDLRGFSIDEFKRMLRTELHFLYFQMTEALFELLFALARYQLSDLWIVLSFSGNTRSTYYSNTYRKIRALALGQLADPDLRHVRKVRTKNGEEEWSLLRRVIYYGYDFGLTPDQWKANLENIESLLKVFAKDFTDRGEYNAYKHSLRLYSHRASLSLGKEGGPMVGSLRSEDAVTFIEEYSDEQDQGSKRNAIRAAVATKAFDFGRDYRCCVAIYRLICNMINTRKARAMADELEQPPQVHTFHDSKVTDFYPSGWRFTRTA